MALSTLIYITMILTSMAVLSKSKKTKRYLASSKCGWNLMKTQLGRAEFDPLGGDLQEATLENQIQDRKRQQELAAIQHDTNLLRAEIDRLKAQQDLVRLQENPDADVPGKATAGGPSTPSGPNDSTPLDASAITKSFDTLQKNPLPDPAKLHSGSAQLTSVEKLRDELAYRNAVHAALRETELDDAHDLNGYTLRTLKFDISVTPHDRRAEHIGMIRLTTNPCRAKLNVEVYRAWQQSVLRQVRLEALSLQRRYMQRLITDDDRNRDVRIRLSGCPHQFKI